MLPTGAPVGSKLTWPNGTPTVLALAVGWVPIIGRQWPASAARPGTMRGHETRPGLDRDEYPPAMFVEGGRGASVRRIPLGDSRGAGSTMGHDLRDVPNGTVIHLITGD